jgi:hypothetical protein
MEPSPIPIDFVIGTEGASKKEIIKKPLALQIRLFFPL